MANADDLTRLAQEVANAYEERVRTILDIKGYTADLLAQTREEIKDREIYIENLLADFNDAREEMGRKIRAELDKVKPALEGAESERKTADQAEIKEREAYIENLLAEFDEEHQEMAEELRAKLARDEKTRKTETQAEINEREVYIENLLADFDKAHQEMAAELRAKLASDEQTRKTETQAEIKERKETVREMLDEFRKDQEETAAAWKELLAGMASLREKVTISGPVGVEAAVEVATVKEAIEEAEIEAGEEIEEEEFEEVEAEDLAEEIVGLLEDNPDGLRMVEIADVLGVENWRSLIPVMRELLNEGEVRKEDSTYYIV